MDLVHGFRKISQFLPFFLLLFSKCSGIIEKLDVVAEKSPGSCTEHSGHVLNSSASDFESSQPAFKSHKITLKKSKGPSRSSASTTLDMESTHHSIAARPKKDQKQIPRLQLGYPNKYIVGDGIWTKNSFSNYHKHQGMNTPNQDYIHSSIIPPEVSDPTLRNLPPPNFVIPYMVPCFFNPEDAAKWSSTGTVFNSRTSTVEQSHTFAAGNIRASYPHFPPNQHHVVHDTSNHIGGPISQSGFSNPGLFPEPPKDSGSSLYVGERKNPYKGSSSKSIPRTFEFDTVKQIPKETAKSNTAGHSNEDLHNTKSPTIEDKHQEDLLVVDQSRRANNEKGYSTNSSSQEIGSERPHQKDLEPKLIDPFPKLLKMSVHNTGDGLEKSMPLSLASNLEETSRGTERPNTSHTNVSWSAVAAKKPMRAGPEDFPSSGDSKDLPISSPPKIDTKSCVNLVNHEKDTSSVLNLQTFVAGQEAPKSRVLLGSIKTGPNSNQNPEKNTPTTSKFVETSCHVGWSMATGKKKRGKSLAKGKFDGFHLINQHESETERQVSNVDSPHATVDGIHSTNGDFPNGSPPGETNNNGVKDSYSHVLPITNDDSATHEGPNSKDGQITGQRTGGILNQECSHTILQEDSRDPRIGKSQKSQLETMYGDMEHIPQMFDSLSQKVSTDLESSSSRENVPGKSSKNEDCTSISEVDGVSKSSLIHKEKVKNTSKKQSKKKGKTKKVKDGDVPSVENTLMGQTSSILHSSLGKMVLQVIQVKNKSKNFRVELDDELYNKITEEYEAHSTTSVTHANTPPEFFEIFRKLNEVYEDMEYISKRMTAFMIQFTEKALVAKLSAMKAEVSPLSKEFFDLLRVEEEFPTFSDLDAPTFRKAQDISKALEILEDIGVAKASSEFDLTSRFEQMMIMSHLDKRAILITQEKMKLFMKQGGKLSVVMEISHCLGFGMEEEKWREMTDDEIRERVKNIVFAMHGRYWGGDGSNRLFQMANTWYSGYEREFMLNEPELCRIFERRFTLLVHEAERLNVKELNDWFCEKERVRNVEVQNDGITFGQVLVGAHFGIPLLNLQTFLGLIHHKNPSNSINPRKQLKRSVYVSKRVHLEGVTNQFENLKKFYKYYDKRILMDNTDSVTDNVNYVVEFD